jgi:peptidoglycan hydrolase-like protein with peptidoglycan-binding domain
MANSTGLLIAAGAAVLLLSGKKKKSSGGGSSSGDTPSESIYGTFDPSADDPVFGGDTPPPSSGGAEVDTAKWNAIQKGLKILGYTEVGSPTGSPNEATYNAIKLFQKDWNTMIGYMASVDAPAVGKTVYTTMAEDGAWGPATKARYDKAMGAFGNPPFEVEDLSMSLNSFRAMAAELKKKF